MASTRLHLRNCFRGWRYQLYPRDGGFALTTTSKLLALPQAHFPPPCCYRPVCGGREITRIRLRVRIGLLYLLDVFLIPTFVLSFLIFVPWPPLVIAGALLALYLLSWFGHRFGAALEANEMIFFVQKALEDFVPAEIFSLNSDTSGVIYANREFGAAWEKFYQAHKDE
jgi:hypothetical protein